MLLNCGVGEDSSESFRQQGDPTSQSYRKSVLSIHWKDWCWSWNSNTLATWCEELTHWKRPWYWERLKAKGKGDDRGLDGWMASPARWTWVWANSGRWWRTGKPGMLQFMELQLNMTEQMNNNRSRYTSGSERKAIFISLWSRRTEWNHESRWTALWLSSLCSLRDAVNYSIPLTAELHGKRALLGNPLQYSCLENPMDGGAW